LGAGIGLRAVSLRDGWARRELKVIVRDIGELSDTGRLVLAHLKAAERIGDAAQADTGAG
jgi:hypothetical protein